MRPDRPTGVDDADGVAGGWFGFPYLGRPAVRTVSAPAGWHAARAMVTRILRSKSGLEILVRPLHAGDTETVQAVFARLGDASRRRRFHGPKPRLTEVELEQLARVDETRHALVGYVPGDPRPVAIARLVRDGSTAEIAFAVVDEHQHKGIGAALTGQLVADARAAGVREVHAHVSYDNQRALAVLGRILDRVEVSFKGPEIEVRAALA